MKTNLPIALLGGLCLSLTGLLSLSLPHRALAQLPGGGETVIVELSSGRSFKAELDPRTDASRLWLRAREGTAKLLRPVHWDRVVRATVAGEQLSGEQLREIVADVRTRVPAQPVRPPVQETIVMKGELAPAEAPPAAPKAAALPTVRSLAIDAYAASWDADAEVDGLLVRVYPLDAAAAAVPARGTLQLELWGRRHGPLKPYPRLVLLQRWTQAIEAEDFGPRGVVVRMPYRRYYPQFDPDFSTYGFLHARLSVPGQGTFEAVVHTVRLFPYGDDGALQRRGFGIRVRN